MSGPVATSLIPKTLLPTNFAINHIEAEKVLANIETTMNVVGYFAPFVPVIGALPGGFRMTYGFLEVGISVAQCAIRFAGACWEKNETKRADLMKDVWKPLAYAEHGLANIWRGFLETAAFLNLILLYWDYSGRRMQYQAEKSLIAGTPASGPAVLLDNLSEGLQNLRVSAGLV